MTQIYIIIYAVKKNFYINSYDKAYIMTKLYMLFKSSYKILEPVLHTIWYLKWYVEKIEFNYKENEKNNIKVLKIKKNN